MTPPATDNVPNDSHINDLAETNCTMGTSDTSSVLDDSQLSEAELSEPADGYETVLTRRNKKKRKSRVDISSRSSSDTIISNITTAPGLTVIFSPIEPSPAWKFNALKLSEKLDGYAPDGVMQIRLNKRLNLIAVDTRNTESTTSLLAITSLCGVKVRAYEPRPTTSTVGVIKDVDEAITEHELLLELRPKVPIAQVRRLGKTRSVRLIFNSVVMPQHVYVGKVRYPVDVFEERGVQCKNCGIFGHVAAVCTRKQICLRCTGDHATLTCEALTPLCVNCGGQHASYSRSCDAWKVETDVRHYKRTHNVSFGTARMAIRAHDKRPALHSGVLLHNRFSTLTEDLPTEDTISADQAALLQPSPSKPLHESLRGPSKAITPTIVMKSKNDSDHPAAGHPPASKAPVSSREELLKNIPPPCTSTFPLQGSSYNNTRQEASSSTKIGDTITMIAEAVKALLSSMSSPLARLAVTVIDVMIPLIAMWCG